MDALRENENETKGGRRKNNKERRKEIPFAQGGQKLKLPIEGFSWISEKERVLEEEEGRTS